MRGAREHEHHRKQSISDENMNINGEKQEMQVLLDFTLFLVLLLFCVFPRCADLGSRVWLGVK
jgi:hypothetical protein